MEQVPQGLRIGDDFDRWDEVFSRLISSRPRDTRLWLAHLNWLAHRGRWHVAASAAARLTELEPDNRLFWYYDAALRLHLGDHDGYRHDCRQMLARFADNPGPYPADLTPKTCLLRPDPGADLDPVLRLADGLAVTPGQDADPRWLQVCRALADYRAGRFVAVVERIERVGLDADGSVIDATAFLLLALGERRRGRPAAARQALARARAIRDRHWPQIEHGQYFGDDWHDWLRFDVLRREAEEAVGGAARPRRAAPRGMSGAQEKNGLACTMGKCVLQFFCAAGWCNEISRPRGTE